MPLYADTAVTALKGVGKTRAEQLQKIGVRTVEDLLFYFPRAFEKRGDIRLLADAIGQGDAAVILTVASEVHSAKLKSGKTIQKFRAFDDSGSCEVIFFNSPYIRDIFHVGCVFRFYGKIAYTKVRTVQLSTPRYEPVIEGAPLPDFVPVYPLTAGLTSKYLSKLIAEVMEEAVVAIPDPLAEDVRLDHGLPTLAYAVRNAHFPESEEALSRAMRRLSFDELLSFSLGISLSSHYKNAADGIRIPPASIRPFTDLLPYELTGAQKRAFNDVYRDMVIGDEKKAVHPMARILVGDVGSGKTVVAQMAMYLIAAAGKQAALMAPTEILAEQHYADTEKLFGRLGIPLAILTGSTPQKEKNRVYAGLADGSIKAVIGTHALLSDKVHFSSLALVITDEQHRFGVTQRAVLKEKSTSELQAHLLVMSATPIPRTLALTLYGDLDVSRIDEMPKGRMRVDTYVVDESYRMRLNDFIRKQVALGGQCYIVCPSIESAENGEEETQALFTPASISSPFANDAPALKNATEYAENLQKSLPDVRVGLLHGKMKGKEKDEIMQRFAEGEIDVLVSTTVIEVGVNVPNATLMIVENAERFGLSQLHQLRGRVGRGTKKSYCVLVSDLKTEKAQARLETMRTTYDGYAIAEKDLLLRGPGDFFSSNTDDSLRQSGGFDFRFSSLCDDTELMEEAFRTAKDIIREDPHLQLPQNALLRKKIEKALSADLSLIS